METVTVHIDGKAFQVEKGQNLLHICLSLCLDLPYFCWHPALHSVGACRQCAIKQFKDENDTTGKIVMACMTPAAEGMRISIDNCEAREFRAAIIEFLMVNHPHDCPVCDEGGECHLQDMTVMTGHNYRNYRFTKRTYRNQYLGPFINHEMNRCIACYRCVRYYRDYADGRDFDVFGAHDRVYFGRFEDGVLENEFSGNLVEVCPTGVFTDKTLQEHYTRKWDLQTAPSICVHCAVGCNTIPGHRYGTLRRVYNRYHHEVNGYFLCDRGRFGYEFVNGTQRILKPLLRGQPVSAVEAFEHLKKLIANRESVIGIGSPRASLESNFALRQLVGPQRFYSGMPPEQLRLMRFALEQLRQLRTKPASLNEVAHSDAVFVLGEDATNSSPMLALALRQAARSQPVREALKQKIPVWHANAIKEIIQDKHSPFFLATCAPSKLESIATGITHAAPDDLARLGFAVAHALDPAAPSPDDLQQQTAAEAQKIADALKHAEHPLIVCGTSLQNEPILRAGFNILGALLRSQRTAQLALCVPECNTMGLALMEANPFDSANRAITDGKASTVIILENDLFRCAESAQLRTLLQSATHVVAIDHTSNATTASAELVLPAATFAETDGTLVNYEGRAQRFYAVFPALGDIRPSWRWLSELTHDTVHTFDTVVEEMANSMSAFGPVATLAPPASFTIAGEKIARQSHRYSGRTAVTAGTDVHELPPPKDPDSPLVFSMEGYQGIPPSTLTPRYWTPMWNSVQALNKFQEEIGGPLKGGDPGRLLLQEAPGGTATYSTDIPASFAPRPGEWLLVPLFHIFGSEELSVLSRSIAELAPKPFIAMNPRDASALGLNAGDLATVRSKSAQSLPVHIVDTMPQGVAGIIHGLPGQPYIQMPAWVRITPTSPQPTSQTGAK